MTICDNRVQLSYLDTYLSGPQIVCANVNYDYTIRAFRQCYNDGCIPISKYIWAINNWEPFADIAVGDKDLFEYSVSFPTNGTHILNVSAVDEDGNVDVAQLAVSSYYCSGGSVTFDSQTKYCINTPITFNAKLNYACNPTSCLSATNYTWYINSSSISSTNVSGANTNSFVYTFNNTGIHTIKVKTTTIEDFACTLRDDTFYYETSVCITDCSISQLSAGIIAKNVSTQLSACTGETIAFIATASLECDPLCIPITAYSWTINGITTNVYSNNLFNIQTYTYNANIADIATVTVYDIAGNTITKSISVDVDSTYCNTKNLELQLAGPPIICNGTTNSLTYSAFATPYYNTGTPTPISAYIWSAQTQFNESISNKTTITSATSSTFALTNITDAFTVSCSVIDISGRSISQSINIIEKNCGGPVDEAFYLDYNGNFNPCSGTQQTYTVNVENLNICNPPIIKQYIWKNNSSIIQTVSTYALSSNLTMTVASATSSIYISAVTVDNRIASTYFTIQPVYCGPAPTVATLTLTGPSAVNYCVASIVTTPPSLPPTFQITNNTYMYFFLDNSNSMDVAQSVINKVVEYIKLRLIKYYNSETEFNNKVKIVRSVTERTFNWLSIDYSNDGVGISNAGQEVDYPQTKLTAPRINTNDNNNVIVFTIQNEAQDSDTSYYDSQGIPWRTNNSGYIDVANSATNGSEKSFFVSDFTRFKNQLISRLNQNSNYYRACVIPIAQAKYFNFMKTVITDSNWQAKNPNYSLKEFNDKIYFATDNGNPFSITLVKSEASAATLFNKAIVPAFKSFGVDISPV